MTKVRYLIDSDALISAKNSWLDPKIAPAFWDWLLEGHNQGCFYSIDKVSSELKEGSEADFLYQFAIDHASIFLSSDELSCITEYAKLQTWANTIWANYQNKKPNKTSKATEAFASTKKADAFLVAYAKANNFVIVTNEVSDMQCQTNIKLPDAANSCGVKTINLYDLLLLHSHNNFQFK